jgi:hypothetical protein
MNAALSLEELLESRPELALRFAVAALAMHGFLAGRHALELTQIVAYSWEMSEDLLKRAADTAR